MILRFTLIIVALISLDLTAKATSYIEKDSTAIEGDTLSGVQQNEDTLVFEDWDVVVVKDVIRCIIPPRSINPLQCFPSFPGLVVDTMPSQPDEVSTNGTDDVQHVEWKFYPNPVQNILKMEYGLEGGSVQIMDLTGKEIFNTSERWIDVSTLAAGTYVIRFVHGDTVESRKFVKF